MYSQIFELQSELHKALAHPRRIEIIQLLRDQNLPVTDIHTMLDLPQANISQHLMILRDAGVVQTERKGKHIFYSLSHPGILRACDALRQTLIDQHEHLAQGLTHSMQDLVPLTHDPVCQMRVSPKTAGFHTHYKNEDWYFCASGCLAKFLKDPEVYATA